MNMLSDLIPFMPARMVVPQILFFVGQISLGQVFFYAPGGSIGSPGCNP